MDDYNKESIRVFAMPVRSEQRRKKVVGVVKMKMKMVERGNPMQK